MDAQPIRHRISIGFSLLRGAGGPTTFLRRLRESIAEQKLARTSCFLNPLTTINIYANVVRNPWRRRFIFRMDGIYFDKCADPELNRRQNGLLAASINKAAGIVYQSAFDKKLVETILCDVSCPRAVIPNGIDLDAFSPATEGRRHLLSIPDRDIVFITSAKWRSHKRLSDTLDVFCRYDASSPTPCHLLVLGGGDPHPPTDHPRIRFIGHVDPADLPSWYRTGNIFLFFSWLDHCPNTVVEALAAGLPVICTNQGGTRELVEATNGGIVVEADEPFPFEPVDLYHPPRPNHDRLVDAIARVAATLPEFAARIDRSPIDINRIAQRYVQFAETLVFR